MTDQEPDQGPDCWARIGIGGDRSCPELERFIHCRNCPVYAAGARRFFERRAPDGYLADWTRLLAAPLAPSTGDEVGALTFRLGEEWLALPARTVVEVTTPRPVHRIPHRSNETLVGMVNLRGRLELMVSLHGLLGVEPVAGGKADAARLVVIRRGGSTWVFAADEVGGVDRFPRAEMAPVPSTLANPLSSFSQAVIPWRGRSVGLLDDARVFESLQGLGR